MQVYKNTSAEIHYETFGQDNGPDIIWTHGWGQDHAAFMPMAQTFERLAKHTLVDFPGFGDSPAPTEPWSTADYADAMATFIKAQTSGKVIWIGHSFGCRVGLQIAARHPDLIQGLFLIAGAGLPRKRPLHHRLSHTARVYLFKALKKLIPLGLNEDWLRGKFGSADYKNAGPMRDILVKTVNEDLSDIARTITCPVKLVYGEKDTQTPPEIGKRLHALINGSGVNNAEFIELEGLDHYTVLAAGRHQVAPLLKKFIEGLSQ